MQCVPILAHNNEYTQINKVLIGKSSIVTYPGVVKVVIEERARLVAAEHFVSLGYRLIYLRGILSFTLIRVLC